MVEAIGSDVSFSWGFEGDPDASRYLEETSFHNFSDLNASVFLTMVVNGEITWPLPRTLS